jgi:succinate dehydrogenase/fumarate reductase flavoprotein subunit
MFMDATQVPLAVIQKVIPYVYKTCLFRGIDITKVPLEVAPGSHTWLGGLEVDVDGKTRVDGLFAAGETAGGIHGGNRIGGSALSSALVFGRRAGRRAAALVKERSVSVLAPIDDAIPIAEGEWVANLMRRHDGPLQADVRKSCCMLAHHKLGPIRDGRTLEEALTEYERIERDDVSAMRLDEKAATSHKVRGQELESALSVRNLALLGRILATAALSRTESRGAHYRVDHPQTDDARWRVVTRVERGPDGTPEFHAEPVKSADGPAVVC